MIENYCGTRQVPNIFKSLKKNTFSHFTSTFTSFHLDIFSPSSFPAAIKSNQFIRKLNDSPFMVKRARWPSAPTRQPHRLPAGWCKLTKLWTRLWMIILFLWSNQQQPPPLLQYNSCPNPPNPLRLRIFNIFPECFIPIELCFNLVACTNFQWTQWKDDENR